MVSQILVLLIIPAFAGAAYFSSNAKWDKALRPMLRNGYIGLPYTSVEILEEIQTPVPTGLDSVSVSIKPTDMSDRNEELIVSSVQLDNENLRGDLRNVESSSFNTVRSVMRQPEEFQINTTEDKLEQKHLPKRTIGRPWSCDIQPEAHWIRFSDDYFPNRVKNFTCITTSCYCVPSTYQMKLLKRRSPDELEEDVTVPSTLRADWVATTITLVTCCNCRRLPL